jgi:hypothetical protein
MQFLNDENVMNKKDSNALSIKSSRSLNYKEFLKSPIYTPSILATKQESPFLSNKLPTTAFSSNSFIEKSKYSPTILSENKKPISSPLFIKSLNEDEENLIGNSNNININSHTINNNGVIKEEEEEDNDNKKYEQSIISDDNASLKLGFYSPILMKNSTHKYKNNHQRSKSEISQPINNHLSVVSPTRSLNEINKFSLSDNNSRKRPANNIDQIINFNDIKSEADQSLILSDSFSQRKTEIKHLNPDNNIVSNKKSKIKSPQDKNVDLNSQPSTSKTYPTIYSESQIEEIKRNLINKYEKELENARKDCMEWEQRCIESNNKHKEIENVLDEYEITLSRMIKDSQKEKEHQELRINELLEERNYLQKTSEIMETSFKELRLKFEEFKTQNDIFSKNEELMKQTIITLQNDVLRASQRYEQIKSHAEEKLELANIEIAKVRKDFDKELSAMKAKLLRKELDTQSLNQKIKALQEQINIKTKENEELATICDALVSKLENK